MFKIYSSSAGSGKTFTLTKEYLKLALGTEDEGYFRHILAVTFTNAAANEMKERIIGSLQAFSSGGYRDHPMFTQIVSELAPETNADPLLQEEAVRLLAARARKVLDKILHQYSDFSVMTIDKFTNRLVNSFADELELPFGFETVLERDLLDQAIDQLLARIGRNGEEVLSEIVEKYYLDKAREGKSWKSLPAELRKTAAELLSESGRAFLSKVSHLDMADWVGIRRQLLGFIGQKEDLIAGTALQALRLMTENGLSESDFFQGRNGIFKYFEQRAQGLRLFDEPNSYIWKTVSEGKWRGGKVSAPTAAAIDGISADLEHYFYLVEETRAENAGQVILYKNVEKHLYRLSLLSEIGKEFEALLRQNNQAHISEFNRKIAEIVSREPVPFIFERLGERYNHVLIDEFQDTSRLQFANLLPLIDNALAKGYFNLVVGDAKQSIYRFRGGDMDLLIYLSGSHLEKLAHALGDTPFTTERLQAVLLSGHTEQLGTNRRSCREITAFNNAFFESLTLSLSVEYPRVLSVFDQHFRQDIPENAASGGHVEIRFVPPGTETENGEETDAGEAAGEPMAETVTALVEDLLSQGYRWKDIAILCRKNSEAAGLANVLKARNWPLISDDSLLLDYAAAIRLLVGLMKVFNQPDNTAEKLETALLFHRVVLGRNAHSAELPAIREMCADPRPGAFIGYVNRYGLALSPTDFQNRGLYEFCETVCGRFSLFGRGEDEYLFRFLDVALTYGNRKNNRTDDFLAYWELRKSGLSITASPHSDAIRITTIHKSKGLEFPVVILPYAHWSYAPRYDQPVWMDLPAKAEFTIQRAHGPGTLTASQVNMTSDLEKTGLAGKYADERERVLIENLNLLYVALTRPVQRLYILPRTEQNWDKPGKTINFWFFDYLGAPGSGQVREDGRTAYVLAESSGQAQPAGAADSVAVIPIDRIRSVDKTGALRLRRMADRIFDVETFEQKLDPVQKAKYALSLLHHEADLPGVLQRLVSEGIADTGETRQLGQLLRQVIENPELRPFFAPEATVLLHREILLPGGRILTPHRSVIDPGGACHVLHFAAGSGLKEAEREVKAAVQAFRSMRYPDVSGRVVCLDDRSVTQIQMIS